MIVLCPVLHTDILCPRIIWSHLRHISPDLGKAKCDMTEAFIGSLEPATVSWWHQPRESTILNVSWFDRCSFIHEILLQTRSGIRNNYFIFGNHQSSRMKLNTEIIVGCVFLLSGSYLLAVWHPGFVFFGDSGRSLVIRTHYVCDSYSRTFFKMDVCLN